MSTVNPATSLNALFAKPDMAVGDLQAFKVLHSSIEECFSTSRVSGFLATIGSCNLRIRDFESVLGRDLLGKGTRQTYEQLDNGDQGQIREFYLGSLERVEPALRQKFFKLYSYY